MEQRLIDADALWKQMEEYDDYMGSKGAHDLNVIHLDSILFAIEQAPTVDAVKVVRCKECKKKFARDEDYKGNILRYICLHGAHEPDFFCADGEGEPNE